MPRNPLLPLAAIGAFAAALLGAFGGATPAAAQSLGLINLPTQPVLIPAVAPSSHARIAYVVPGSDAAGQPILFAAQPANLPQWRPPGAGQPPIQAQVQAQTQRFVGSHRVHPTYGAPEYGPFRVIDARTVALLGETDAMSPSHFARLLRDHPGLARLEMVECPGTMDDRANLEVGRMIRRAGLATVVPAHGSVRSGAVELFLAGVDRRIDNGAEFAVHSWRDEYGREAGDFAVEAPQNHTYLAYYREMGMDDARARAFYAMTNSVPHHRARWLRAGEMRSWVDRQAPSRPAMVLRAQDPRIAYLSIEVS